MLSTIVREYDKHLFHLFLLLLLWAPIPLGSNRVWSAMLLVFVSAVLFSLWLILFLKDKVRITPSMIHARWALVSLFCFQLWVFVQTLALPVPFIKMLSPQVLFQYQQGGFQETAYLSLSVDSSLKAFVLGLGLSLSFVLTLLLINTRQRKLMFYQTLVLSGVLQAGSGVLMLFSDRDLFAKILQLFHSNALAASGTFVNSNHFAGYLNICLAMGLGLYLSSFKKQRYTRFRLYLRSLIEGLLSANMRLRIYLMIMLVALILSYSRMGNAAFFGALTISAMILLLKMKKFNGKVLLFFVSLLVIDVLLVSAWFGSDKLVKRIEETNFTSNTRTEINAVSRPLMSNHLLSGVGADAYKVIEPAYKRMPSDAITEHAHNDYYEFVINTGLAGVFFLLIFLFLIGREVFNFKNTSADNSSCADNNDHSTENSNKPDFGLMMLLIYVAIHSLADFNLQIPAFSFTLLACLALAFIKDSNKQNLPTKADLKVMKGGGHAV